MTEIVICNCGHVQEYESTLEPKCQHCNDELLSYDIETDEYEF